MKEFRLIFGIAFLALSNSAFAWVVNGVHSIDKLGINHVQINVSLSNGFTCFLDTNHAKYKEMVSLLHTLYASGKKGYFRCTETTRQYSPWETNVTTYEILEVTGQK
ncbi:MAG: hypothetical protein OEW58_11415 [Gammaproteobacteria bacterium]|nr:hypothetical protein [Gammaproteobacteria bacterium]